MKAKISKRRAIVAVTAVVLVVFTILCSRLAGLAEWYVQTIYPVIAAVLSFISSIIPFSLFDVLITAYIVLFVVGLVLLVCRKIKFRRWVFTVLSSIVTIIIWFYMVWGISYFRYDFYARTNTPQAAFDSINFKSFMTDYVQQLNASYVPFETIDYAKVDADIELSYQKLHNKLNLPYPCGKRRVKSMIYEKWITKVGVSGYFGPFFNEVHVNRYPLVTEQPSVIAHEKAHQFGIASEAECNLYAYIVCTESNNPQVRYSGYLEALGYVLSNARKLLPNEYAMWYTIIDPRIKADYNASAQHWQNVINPAASNAQRKVYDAYLKTNKVKSGVDNYSEMVALLVSWHNNRPLLGID